MAGLDDIGGKNTPLGKSKPNMFKKKKVEETSAVVTKEHANRLKIAATNLDGMKSKELLRIIIEDGLKKYEK